MPRDDEREHRGRRPGRSGRPRGKDGRPRADGARKMGGTPRFDREPSGERKFGGKRRFDKPAGFKGGFKAGFRKDGDGPARRAPDREERSSRAPARPRDDRPARATDGKRFSRKFDKPAFGNKRRHDDDGSRRGRFSGERGERWESRAPRTDRPREDRRPRDGAAWRDHPRGEGERQFPGKREGGHAERPKDAGRRDYEKRPAFGGRGPYRERKPGTEKSFRKKPDADRLSKKSGERIAKRMARAGLCSRREAEQWISEGRVVVNGRVINSPALDVNERDIVTVDGAPLPERERTRLFLYHKPRALVTTHNDPEGRSTIFDNLPKDLPRLISIGRLDYNTEGLLLLTNDGGLKRVLELPETGWLRRYRVRAHGTIAQAKLHELRDGIEVDGVKYGPIEATLDQQQGSNIWLTVAIREGKNREVRNVLSHLGLEVNRLIRVSYGPFQLGELAEGEVSEVRGRMLRDQLGERIAQAASADFSAPLRHHEAEQADDAEHPRRRNERPETRRNEARPEKPPRQERPRMRAGLIADGKGRRVLVQRIGRSEDEPRRGPKRLGKRSRPYKGRNERQPRGEE